MITAERLAEIAIDGREAMPTKTELIELVNAYGVDYADLQRQLAEAKAEIEALLSDLELATDMESVGVVEAQRKEIEAMRPVVDAAMWHERVFRKINHPNCGLCKRVREYEARKQP